MSPIEKQANITAMISRLGTNVMERLEADNRHVQGEAFSENFLSRLGERRFSNTVISSYFLSQGSKISLFRNSECLWQDYLPFPALLVAGTRKFLAILCEENSLFILSHAGRRYLFLQRPKLLCRMLIRSKPTYILFQIDAMYIA
jgi:hypothetical protein